MKTPSELAARLASQWQNPDLREKRLLDEEEWPIRLPIGRPPARAVSTDWTRLTEHIRSWRAVRCGNVQWEKSTYRATGAPVEIPISWEISSMDEWIHAAADRSLTAEHAALDQILKVSLPVFHSFFIRQRSVWRNKPIEEVALAARISAILEPGYANGRPLRLLSLEGIDSKFFERHEALITRLLDLRFDGETGRQGLETFLGAWQESDHWLLVADLDGTILPFKQQRVRTKDLIAAAITPPRVLVVENEKCLHLLPDTLPGVIVVLGSGNGLGWLSAPWVQSSHVGYWGDLDTWGLTLLAVARAQSPGLTPILMTLEIFESHTAHAVSEPVPAHIFPPELLTPLERDLYNHLLGCDRGRLEQEFLRATVVANAIEKWMSETQA